MSKQNMRMDESKAGLRDLVGRALLLYFSAIITIVVSTILVSIAFYIVPAYLWFESVLTLPLIVIIALALVLGGIGWFLTSATTQDFAGRIVLITFAIVTSMVIVFIFASVWVRAFPALVFIGPALWGTQWDPNNATNPQFGILPFISGTLWVSGFSLIFAIPLGVAGSLFLSEYCPQLLKEPLRMLLLLMAGIPSIVYGLWGMFTLIPFLRAFFRPLFPGGQYNGFGILPASIVLAIMLLPTVVAVSFDAMSMVPDTLREASYALGASRTETTVRIVFRTALPGIGAAVLLSLGRAIGETMAVLLLTGNWSGIPTSIFSQAYVMTSVIANQLGLAVGGYPAMESALFVIALALLIMSMLFSLAAKLIVHWGMRKQGLK